MENDQRALLLAQMLPGVATQLRAALGNIYFSAAALAPAEAREADPVLDQKAALLDQAYYRMLRLVDNLTVAAYFGREGFMTFTDQDLVDTVRETCLQCSSLADLMGIGLTFVCTEQSHVCAVYRDSIVQLLFQLLSNAFKFTGSGGSVTVELRFSGGQALLSVVDTGRGIPEDLMPILFDRCMHGDVMDPPPHGLGMGLPLCWQIANAHGGSIMAESKEGNGTRITLSIPDRITGNTGVSDVRFDYAGGFNRTLLALADALPAEAFRLRNQE